MIKPTITESDFNRMTPAEQRVAIAKDVLMRLDEKNIVPKRGALFGHWASLVEDENDSAKEFINNRQGCSACAKGALVCSWIGNFNKVKSDDLYDLCYDLNKLSVRRETFPKGLLDTFGREMLDDMEAAFESGVYEHSYRFGKAQGEWPRAEGDLSYFFHLKTPYVMDLPAIMENVIANGGTFVFNYERARKDYLECFK